ncbi:MAG: hypothetical protein J1F11_02510 [Oscillospiraceae bacterium]|nr:hypothetical protein [Oscillospiraceae bacterium]
MSSKKREQEYDNNRRHYKEIQGGFKFGLLTTVIPAGTAVLGMILYYFIRGLAMLAGATMLVGQWIVNTEMGAESTGETSGLGYAVDYGFIAYLLAAAVLAIVAFSLKKKVFNKILLLLFIAGGLYGLTGMFTGSCSVVQGLFLFAFGSYETWLELYLLRLHRELDELSLKEGFPDFIIALNEPKTMANTSGLTYKQSEFQKRQRKEEGYEKLPVNTAMDELTLDTELPKGNRKIDNMM